MLYILDYEDTFVNEFAEALHNPKCHQWWRLRLRISSAICKNKRRIYLHSTPNPCLWQRRGLWQDYVLLAYGEVQSTTINLQSWKNVSIFVTSKVRLWRTYYWWKCISFYPWMEIWKISKLQGRQHTRHSVLVCVLGITPNLNTGVGYCLFVARYSRTSIQIN